MKNNEKEKSRLQAEKNFMRLHPEKAETVEGCYGKKVIVQTYDGTINFDPDSMRDLVGAQKLTYDEYLDVQIRSFGKIRGWFEACYHNIPLGFKGRIEKKTEKHVCFERITGTGMYPDGECFDGKADHVWMAVDGFEEYSVGDSVSFHAEVYRYVKTGNGKHIDFGLRAPTQIERIKPYELPSDDELMRQTMREIACETCFLSEQCNRVSCVLDGAK